MIISKKMPDNIPKRCQTILRHHKELAIVFTVLVIDLHNDYNQALFGSFWRQTNMKISQDLGNMNPVHVVCGAGLAFYLASSLDCWLLMRKLGLLMLQLPSFATRVASMWMMASASAAV